MLDEPTAALSVKETHAVLDLMETLKERGIATVFITHNIHHAYAVSDHFVALNAGVKVLDADKADVTPEMLTEAVIGEPLAQVSQPIPCRVRRQWKPEVPMKVQAALCLQDGAPLEIREVDLAAPGPGEVLVRWGASGICASDKFVVTHAGWPKPYIPGHEGAGVVEALGEGVRTLAEGDHVVSDLLGACGHCRQCRTGRPRLCEPQRRRAVPDKESLFSLDGVCVGRFGHHEIATFVEACVVPEASLTKIPDDVPFEAACLLGCCALSGAAAVLTRAKVRARQPGRRLRMRRTGTCRHQRRTTLWCAANHCH